MIVRDVIIFIVSILLVNITWFSIHPVFTLLQGFGESNLASVAGALTAITNVRTTFDWMIPLFSVVLIVWLFLSTQRREPDWGMVEE